MTLHLNILSDWENHLKYLKTELSQRAIQRQPQYNNARLLQDIRQPPTLKPFDKALAN